MIPAVVVKLLVVAVVGLAVGLVYRAGEKHLEVAQPWKGVGLWLGVVAFSIWALFYLGVL